MTNTEQDSGTAGEEMRSLADIMETHQSRADLLARHRANLSARTLANLATARRRTIVAGSTDRAVVETHGGDQ